VTRRLAVLVGAAIVAGCGKHAHVADPCAATPFATGYLGAVAYMRGETLHVVDLSRGTDRVVATIRTPAALEWSPDGRWIVAGDTLVSVASGTRCRPFGAGAFGLQWRPHSRSLIATTEGGQTWEATPGQPPGRLLPHGFTGESFDPSGRRLLAEGPKASLWAFDLGRGTRSLLWRSPSPYGRVGPPIDERWSPDGRWILFQTAPFHSNSIAADGLPLRAVSVRGGKPVGVERAVLGGDDFVQTCGRRLVVSAGFDRYVSAHKRVDIVEPPSWKPRSISNDARHSWYAAACAPGADDVAATVTTNREEGRFDTAERSLWLLAVNGSRRRLLAGKPGDHISDEQPRWSRAGSWILYFQHPSRPYPKAVLYLVNTTTGARRGPFGRIDGGLGYYGRHDWDALAPWYRPA